MARADKNIAKGLIAVPDPAEVLKLYISIIEVWPGRRGYLMMWRAKDLLVSLRVGFFWRHTLHVPLNKIKRQKIWLSDLPLWITTRFASVPYDNRVRHFDVLILVQLIQALVPILALYASWRDGSGDFATCATAPFSSFQRPRYLFCGIPILQERCRLSRYL